MQRHADHIAAADGGRSTDRCRAIGIPAYGVSARQHGERAQRLQTSREDPESCVRAVPMSECGTAQTIIGGADPAANGRETPPHIPRLERQAKRAVTLLFSRDLDGGRRP